MMEGILLSRTHDYLTNTYVLRMLAIDQYIFDSWFVIKCSFEDFTAYRKRIASVPDQFQGALAPVQVHWSKRDHKSNHSINGTHVYKIDGQGIHHQKQRSMGTGSSMSGSLESNKRYAGSSGQSFQITDVQSITTKPIAHVSHENYERHITEVLKAMKAGQSKLVFIGDSCLSQIRYVLSPPILSLSFSLSPEGIHNYYV